MKIVLGLCLILSSLAAGPARAAPTPDAARLSRELTTEVVKNENLGEFSVSYPSGWKCTVRHHLQDDTTYLRLFPPNMAGDFEIMVNDRKPLGLIALTDGDLERYLILNTLRYAKRSEEKTITPVRFGAGNDGAYVLLTDSAPAPGEFKYWIRGIRLLGDRGAALFNFYSNTRDDCERMLPIVASLELKQVGSQ